MGRWKPIWQTKTIAANGLLLIILLSLFFFGGVEGGGAYLHQAVDFLFNKLNHWKTYLFCVLLSISKNGLENYPFPGCGSLKCEFLFLSQDLLEKDQLLDLKEQGEVWFYPVIMVVLLASNFHVNDCQAVPSCACDYSCSLALPQCVGSLTLSSNSFYCFLASHSLSQLLWFIINLPSTQSCNINILPLPL